MPTQNPSPSPQKDYRQCLLDRINFRRALCEQAEQAKQSACPAPACISRDDAIDHLYDAQEHIEFIIHYLELCSQVTGIREIDCRIFTIKTILQRMLEQHFAELDAFISQ